MSEIQEKEMRDDTLQEEIKAMRKVNDALEGLSWGTQMRVLNAIGSRIIRPSDNGRIPGTLTPTPNNHHN